MLTVHPSNVVILRAGGHGDMGTIGDDSVPGMFRYPGNVPWVLLFLRLHFEDLSGSASGTADCVVRRDRRVPNQTKWNSALWEIEGVGLDIDANFQVPPEEYCQWAFGADEAVTLLWTNPDSGNLGWGVEAGMVAQSEVR